MYSFKFDTSNLSLQIYAFKFNPVTRYPNVTVRLPPSKLYIQTLRLQI